jgi:CheY-like chemotaxis protein
MNISLPDLVLTDIIMPLMDGFDLLAYMNKNYPQIPVFVMTAKGSPEMETKASAMGAVRYFEKPIDIDYLAECVMAEFESEGAEGQLQGITLVSFLQMVEVEDKTCTLAVSKDGKKGFLSCMDGELINAEVGILKGLEAAYELISWENASIEIINTVVNENREIDLPLMNIIMEGTNRKDEKSHF